MILERVPILWNNYISGTYYHIGIACSQHFSYARSGQFVMLRFENDYVPFLSRPFSIHKLIIQNNVFQGIEVLYKVVGKFTEKLSQRKQGEIISVFGPLGNYFKIVDGIQRVFLVGGGVGIAPMPFLASELSKNGLDLTQVTAFIGGRTEADILCGQDFTSCQMPIYISTEDGTMGEKGMITDLLAYHITKAPPDIIYACGPQPMLEKVSKISKQYGIPCQVSIETVMACGMGACMGCAVPSTRISDIRDSTTFTSTCQKASSDQLYLRACVDGPVFDASMISW